jgi:hypothetical protein
VNWDTSSLYIWHAADSEVYNCKAHRFATVLHAARSEPSLHHVAAGPSSSTKGAELKTWTELTFPEEAVTENVAVVAEDATIPAP